MGEMLYNDSGQKKITFGNKFILVNNPHFPNIKKLNNILESGKIKITLV